MFARAPIATEGLPEFAHRGEKTADHLDNPPSGWHPSRANDWVPGGDCKIDETGYDCIFDPHVVYLNRLKGRG
jgi:hypothetical protein